jgi:Fe-S cluster assembly ATP-binding protein
MKMIKIDNLHASINGKEILKGLNLEVKAGEVHAIMGPNGAGKSTLASVLAGREEYEITDGEVTFDGKDLLELSTEDRAREGLFLAFQYPVEIPGVSNVNFLRTALNEKREYLGQDPISAKDFMQMVRDKSKIVELDSKLAKSEDNATIVITHYQRLLDYIVPDYVHVLYNGKIVKSGPKELALELEEKGYDWIKAEFGE